MKYKYSISCNKYMNNTYDYWKKRNVPFRPPVTFFGNLWDSIIMKKSLGEVYNEIYNTDKNARYIGYYKIRKPGLLIRDADIIKDILIKDFHNFERNDVFVDKKSDPIAAGNPFFQYSQEWKTSRSQLSYCFTTGKMKHLFSFMYTIAQNMVKYIDKEIKLDGNPFDTKELASKFTSDNVAICAFGIEGQAFEDPNAEFRKIGRKIMNPSTTLALKMLLMFLFPSCSKIFNVKFIPEEAANYFKTVIRTTLQYRKENNIVRNDFLDAVTQIKAKPGEPHLTTNDIVSHAVSFFGDGFETSSITLSFFLYDMAANIDIQQKLRDEIHEIIKNHDNTLTYETIQDMGYLDRALSESLRLHPPALFLSKMCTHNYVLPPCDMSGKKVQIEENTPVIIPVYSLHHDPKYFPNPEKFDPDRFLDSNKVNIAKGSYLPFGEGPRICIGMKFALLQVKVAAVLVIQNFDVRVNKKTKEPLEINPQHFMLLAKGGLWLDFHKRSN
ncbi:hypothetical protein Trydic_g22778 [Trypoxylus dichotomus]